MGINYDPTDREIKEWRNMLDTNNDGSIEIDEYLNFIKSNLLKAGIFSENWDKK